MRVWAAILGFCQLAAAADVALYETETINDSTHLIINHDRFVEYPYIYVKLYQERNLAMVIDTGCGAHNGVNGTASVELKDYIDANIIPESLEHKHKKWDYLVFCTHCHFDHISGIEAFHTAGAEIIASGHNKTFLAPENRDDSSLCSAFGLELPDYKIDRYVKDGERLKHKGKDLGLKVIHTPGHTPDQMAVFDEEECWLFTGDTIYQRAKEMPWGEVQDVPIILVGQGNWTDYVRSLKKLQDFVQEEEGSRCAKDQCAGGRKQIHLGAGHTTQAAPALQFIKDGREFVARVVDGDVPIIATLPGDEVAPGGTLGDENFLFWQDDGEPLFSILAPERFQKDFPGSRQYLPKVPSSAGDEAEQ